MSLQYSSADDLEKQTNSYTFRRSDKMYKQKLWKSISQDVCFTGRWKWIKECCPEQYIRCKWMGMHVLLHNSDELIKRNSVSISLTIYQLK
jgi:hypothetical protein